MALDVRRGVAPPPPVKLQVVVITWIGLEAAMAVSPLPRGSIVR